MKKVFLKGFAGILAAAMCVLAYFPISAQAAAGQPAISLTTAFYNVEKMGVFVTFKNNGTFGDTINAQTWNLTEKFVEHNTGWTIHTYTEARRGLDQPLYVDTSRMRPNIPYDVVVTADCPAANYSFTTSFLVENGKPENDTLAVVTAASAVSYNGGPVNDTIDVYRQQCGPLARKSFELSLPQGYMIGAEGCLTFNYREDYANRQGIVCIKIPDGVYATNRTFKLATLNQNGIVNICDDIDVNPTTISASINFNGFAIALLYKEEEAAAGNPLQAGSGAALNQIYMPISNYHFDKVYHGPACYNTLNACRPLGYNVVGDYALVVGQITSISPKNGLVTIAVDGKYSEYKLITVDGAGGVQILNDVDVNAGTASFLVNFNGYACQLIGK